MGQVFRARDRSLGRDVALKVLNPELWESARARERMAREAGVLARIRHPNVVGIYDVFEADGALVLALELVGGGTLSDRLRAGALPLGEAWSLMDAVLAGLEAIQREGVVHRDLKPANVLVAEDGTPKIADLGVARDSTVQALTATGAQLGTLDYMSPEQIRGGEIGPAADVYAAGVLLFELCTGALPFAGKTDFEVMAAHLNQAPNLVSLQARAPLGLVHVVARALAKSPSERWPGARELREALALAARSSSSTPPVGAVGVPYASAAPQRRSASTSPAGPATPAEPRRRSRARSRSHRVRQVPEPLGPGTMVVNALRRSSRERGGWCLPVALLFVAGLLILGLLLAAAIALGAWRLGGPLGP